VGAQAMANAKVQDPNKTTDEVDISPSGIANHQKEQKQPAFDGNIGDLLIISSVRVHQNHG
jgi:hypothetical protein